MNIGRLSRPWFNSLVIAFAIGAFLTAIGAYFSYTAIGTPLSNAVGTTIRSTVVSGLGPLILVAGVLVIGLTAVNYAMRYWKQGLKVIFIIGLIIAGVSSPFLIYYNFYYSYSEIISGSAYIVYPYAVQTGIPFMLGLLVSFMAGVSILAEKYGKKSTRLKSVERRL